MRAKRCPICLASPDVTARVNALLESGVKLAGIVAEIGQFSTFQLSRHRNRCMAPAPRADVGPDELQTWMQRCTDSYHVAVANGDSRSAIAACSAATRQLVALAKRQEKEAEASKDNTDCDTAEFTIKGCDAMLRRYAAMPEDFRAIDARAVQLLGDQTFRQLVSQIWEHRDLLPMLLAAATTNYIAPTEAQNATAND